VSVPTDCPQRDERLGWTGDAQAFAPTASTLFESETFWSSWLRDLAIEQDPKLGVTAVVPDVVLGGEPRFGRAGWADAATMVPAAVYESYGDVAVLKRQMPSMLTWVDSLVARRGDDGLLPEEMQFGDWLDPDAPSDRPWAAKADSTFIANAFFAHSARLTAWAARILGNRDDADRLSALGDEIAGLTWARWHAHARTTQTGCAIAISFRICPDDERAAIGDALAQMVDDADGRVSTGFLGTPLVLPALADTGHFDAAYRMLLRHEPPSWLYQVDRGATTVWERWDAIRADGSIHDGRMAPMPEDPDAHEGHMLSFNHYAYGAVIDWVYRNLAGIAPDPDRPGYRHVIFAPRPVQQVDWAKASVRTALGLVSTEWRLDGSALVMNLSLPVGCAGTVNAPVTADSVVTIDGVVSKPIQAIGPGTHSVRVTAPLIARGRAHQEVVRHG
jgi:alpha-L-rhamnosidase